MLIARSQNDSVKLWRSGPQFGHHFVPGAALQRAAVDLLHAALVLGLPGRIRESLNCTLAHRAFHGAKWPTSMIGVCFSLVMRPGRPPNFWRMPSPQKGL
jgi:hypothetical protein